MNSLSDKIQRHVRAKNTQGWAFSAKDFLDLGNRAAVDQALSRLTKAGTIRRVARGIYDMPRKNALLTVPAPASLDAVVSAIARRDNVVVVPDGSVDANQLGLTTAVAARPLYWTNGNPRTVRLGRRMVQMKRMPGWLNYWVDRPASSVVKAMQWLGPRLTDDSVALQLRGKVPPIVARDLKQGISRLPTRMQATARKVSSLSAGD